MLIRLLWEPFALVIYAFLLGHVTIWVRLRNAPRATGVTLLLILVTAGIGQLPSLLFLAAQGLVTLQHGLHPVLCVLLLVPGLLVAAFKVLPEPNTLWTYLTLCALFHAAHKGDWSRQVSPDFIKSLRFRNLMIVLLVGAVLWLVSAGEGKGIVVIAAAALFGAFIWQKHLHSLFHSIGARFAAG